MKRPTRRGLTLVMALAAPLLAGCGLSPAGTTRPYAPSDGVSSAIGAVQVRNLLVVGSAANAPGVVSGALLNDGTTPVTVTVGLPGGEGTPVDVPAQGSVLLGAQTGAASASPGQAGAAVVQLASLPQPPGSFIDVTLSTPAAGTTTVNVPVLPPTLEYSTITPTGPSPTTTPTSPPEPAAGSPTTSVTGTPGPSSEPPTSTTTRPATPTSAPEGTASADPNASATQ